MTEQAHDTPIGTQAREPQALPWRHPLQLALLAFVFAVQLTLLFNINGYQLADSVEYMDRAWDVARGAGLGPESPRSFAFSALLLPVFAAAEWLGGDDFRWAVIAVRLGQVVLGLLAVRVVTRSAVSLYGITAGLSAGLVFGINPIFLQYSVAPLSSTAASLALVMGAEALFIPGPGGIRPAKAGFWLAAAILMAFQTIPVVGVLLLVGLLRERRRLPGLKGLVLAFFGVLLGQCLLDWAIYGHFGSSLWGYLSINFGSVLATLLVRVGATDLAMRLYDALMSPPDIDAAYRATNEGLRSLTPPDWYVTQATEQFLSWPILLLLGLGVLRSLVRPRWASSALLICCLANLLLLSTKGSKDFRLVLPLWPLMAILCGSGAQFLLTGLKARLLGVGKLAWVGCLILGSLLSLQMLRGAERGQHGAYWSALEQLEQHLDSVAAERVPPGEKARVGSAWYWAVLFQTDERMQLTKLPHHLEHWDGLSDPAREEILLALAEYDYFIGHQGLLSSQTEFWRALNGQFAVLGVTYDAERHGATGPVFLFGKRDLAPDGRALIEWRSEEATSGTPLQGASEWGPQRGSMELDLGGTSGPTALSMLAWDVEISQQDGFWLRLHWRLGARPQLPFHVHKRIADTVGHTLWAADAWALGLIEDSEWSRGALVATSHFIPVPLELRRFGGAYGRGDQIPVEIYVGFSLEEALPGRDSTASDNSASIDSASEPSLLPQVTPRRETQPPLSIRTNPLESWRSTRSDGFRVGPGGLVMVGGFWYPVPGNARFPAAGEEL